MIYYIYRVTIIYGGSGVFEKRIKLENPFVCSTEVYKLGKALAERYSNYELYKVKIIKVSDYPNYFKTEYALYDHSFCKGHCVY